MLTIGLPIESIPQRLYFFHLRDDKPLIYDWFTTYLLTNILTAEIVCFDARRKPSHYTAAFTCAGKRQLCLWLVSACELIASLAKQLLVYSAPAHMNINNFVCSVWPAGDSLCYVVGQKYTLSSFCLSNAMHSIGQSI